MESILKREVSPQARGIGRDNYQSNIYVTEILIGPLLHNPFISGEQKRQVVSFMPSPALVFSVYDVFGTRGILTSR